MENFEVIIRNDGSIKTLSDVTGFLTNYLYDGGLWKIDDDGNDHYEETTCLIMEEECFLWWENILKKYRDLDEREENLYKIFGKNEVNKITYKCYDDVGLKDIPSKNQSDLDKAFGLGVGIIAENGSCCGYDSSGYSTKGEDKDGFDRDGWDRDGWDRDGWDRDGYDRGGYGRDGWDRNGYDRDGFDRDGFDRDGWGGYGRD